MPSELKGKKILFIGPVFHTYHQAIIDKLHEVGATVTFFPERDYGLIYKAVNNIFNRYLSTYQEQHYKKIIEKTQSDTFDFLFVVRGYKMPVGFVEEFKKHNRNARTIMYQWDSNVNNPFVNLIPHFDKAFSFDFDDCKANPQLSYLPLFYLDDIKALREETPHETLDFFFMGSYNQERYRAMVDFREFVKHGGYTWKAFLHIPLTSYIKEKLKGIRLDLSLVSFMHMQRRDYLQLLRNSRIIVDVSSSRQSGMAMRIIEAIACNKKILTNNSKLTSDPLFTSGKIMIFDVNQPVVPPEFIHAKGLGQTQDALSIREWLDHMFIGKGRVQMAGA